MSSYDKKIDKYRKESFTGQIFTNEEFLEHLNNINFHAEYAVLCRLPADKLRKVKNLFTFEGYGAGIKGLPWDYTMNEFERFIKSV